MMNKELELAQDKIIDKVGNICSRFGLNQFVAQLYVVLYLSKEPISLDELTERLKVSKGNVSVNIRELQRWGAVRKIWVKGSRKDFYQADPDIKKVILSKVKSAVKNQVREVSDMIAEFNSTLSSLNGGLDGADKEVVKCYKERMKKVQELNNFTSNILKVAGKLL